MVDRPRTLFFLGLSLLDRNRGQEEAWVEALPGLADKIDGILLVVPSWQEAPDATNHTLVERAYRLCMRDLDLYWGRRLWITWQNLVKSHAQHEWDVYDSAYYATFLSRLAAEANAIGATGTIAECEPYGDKHNTDWFKEDGFGPWNRRKVRAAITAAKKVAPAATLAYPAGSMVSDHYSWPIRYLGKQFLHSKTYTITSPEQIRIAPPSSEVVQMDWWGSWITTTGNMDSGKTAPLTMEQYRNLDWAEIRAAHPELKGSWIFAAREDRLAVMEALGA